MMRYSGSKQNYQYTPRCMFDYDNFNIPLSLSYWTDLWKPSLIYNSFHTELVYEIITGSLRPEKLKKQHLSLNYMFKYADTLRI
jgi:hypothetical protein